MSAKDKDYNTQFLGNSGEMAGLLRSKDWSKNILGPLENWPQSLRTTLSIVLNSKFPMFLWWGFDLVCLYNDAYRAILGTNGKHPAILGQGAADAWPETWHIIKPLIDQVLTSGEATWSENQLIPIFRNGKIEDVYWTFSYSPGYDESGKIAGVIVTCNETTGMVNNLIQLANSKDELQFAIEATELGTFDYNPETNKFSANQRLKDWFGLCSQTEIDLQHALDAIAEKDRQRVTDAIRKTLEFSSGGLYNIEYTVIHPITKKETIVRAMGRTWFKENQKAYRFNGTLQDITGQSAARKKIEASEKRFQAAVAAVEGIIWTNNAEGKMEGEQPAWAALTGQSYEDYQGYGWAAAIHPDDAQPTLDAWNEAVKERKGFIFEHRVKLKNESWGEFSVRAIPVFNEEGYLSEWVGVHTDITEQKNAGKKITENEQRFRTMIDNIPNLAWMAHADGWIFWYNKKWYEYSGTTIEKMAGWGWQSLHDPEELPRVIKKWQSSIESGLPFEMTFPLKGANGKFRQFLTRVLPVTNSDGKIHQWFGTNTDITERMEAEEALKESEERFRTMAEGTDIFITTSDETGNATYFNKAWTDLTGQPMTNLLKFGWADLMHPNERDWFVNSYLNAFERRETIGTEFRIVDKAGNYRWLLSKSIPLFRTDRSFAGYIKSCIDITERKKAEEALQESLEKQMVALKKIKESEDKLNIVIDASELGTWEINLKTKEIIASDRFFEITGYKNKIKLTLNDAVKLIHTEDLDKRENAFRQAFKTGLLYFSSRIIWEDNSVHWVEIKGKVFFDDQQNPLNILGTIGDITDDKLREQILFDSEQKFRLLADSMPQHIWTSDAEGNLNYFNQSVFNYSGLTPEDVCLNGWIQIVHPEDREGNINAWKNAVCTGQDFLFEHRFRRYDGEYRWQLSRAIPQTDASGNIQMWVGTSTDIQDQKNSAYELEKLVSDRTNELKQKNKELEKMNGELQSFAYVSSHDLQEPLRKIQTFATRILDKEINNLSENGKDYFRRMQDAAKRMQTLIEDLLAYSRTNTTERNFENTDLNIIIEQVKAELKEDIEQKNAIIDATELCEANIIPFQFRQLVHNLIGNAIKFSKAGKPPHIIIKSSIVDGAAFDDKVLSPQILYCHLSVTDNGIGFDPQYKDRIFEVFQRLHGKDEYKGTGIGLAIVKKIVENHHGVIKASGQLNKGATFDIYLPVS